MSEVGRLEKVRLGDITLDPRLQCRASIDMATVDAYAEVVESGEPCEGRPPRLYWDGEFYWMADGWHRWHAHRKLGKTSMECRVVDGTFQDALRYAVGANATHGKQRTSEDKWRAVSACFEDKELSQHSTREIAELCRVSRDLVERVRKGFEADANPPQRVGKDGNKQAATKPSKPAENAHPPEWDEPDAKPIQKNDAPKDAKGREIPKDLRDVFNERDWFRYKVQTVTDLVKEMEAYAKQEAGAFLAVQSFKIAAESLAAEYKVSRPYIVCPACAGTTREAGLANGAACRVCRADGKPRGWLPAGKWGGLTADLKAIADGFKKGDSWEGEA